MFKLKSEDKFKLSERGQVFVVKCPTTVDRNKKALLEILGEVEIDGSLYKATDFETFCLTSPLKPGDVLGILVE